MTDPVRYTPIGVIRTPYRSGYGTPYQPVQTPPDDRSFRVELDPEYSGGLDRLGSFRYLYLLFHLDRAAGPTPDLRVAPPWAGGVRVGLFASRAPARPNPIGLSIVRCLEISGNRIFTSAVDALDGTPLLDIKPYLVTLDAKADADDGWLEGLPGRDHLRLHLLGIPHDD